MATDRFGRTIVDPHAPLGIEDFARMYTSGGNPDEVATRLHMDAPTAGKSFLEAQWARLGINEAPESYFRRQMLDRTNKINSLAPRNAEGHAMTPGKYSPEGLLLTKYSGEDLLSMKDGLSKVAANPLTAGLAGMANGVLSNHPAAQIATLQNTGGVGGTSAVGGAGTPSVIDAGVAGGDKRSDAAYMQAQFGNTGTDEEVARRQIAGGGTDMLNIIRKNGGTTGDVGMTGGHLDYSGVRPIRRSEELTSNPAFQALASRDPSKAADIYHKVIGRDYSADVEAETKNLLARNKSLSQQIESGFFQGNLRTHPTYGYLERKNSVDDPTFPGRKIDSWEPADEALQRSMGEGGGFKNTFGYEASPWLQKMSRVIPRGSMNQFFAKYRQLIGEGKDETSALTAAFGAVPESGSPQSILATLQSQQQAMTPPQQVAHGASAALTGGSVGVQTQGPYLAGGGAADPREYAAQDRENNAMDPREYMVRQAENSSTPPKDPAMFQAWASAQTRKDPERVSQMGSFIGSKLATGARAVSRAGDAVLNPVSRVALNMGGGLWNLANRGLVLGGDAPLPWYQPLSKEEMAIQAEERRKKAADAPPLDYWSQGY